MLVKQTVVNTPGIDTDGLDVAVIGQRALGDCLLDFDAQDSGAIVPYDITVTVKTTFTE